MYDVVGDSLVPGEEGEGEEGWKVGLCDGACRGFLGKREMGGECRTSDCALQPG
jgi:hypothetical protein